MLTSILRVDDEFVDFVRHSLAQTLAVDVDVTGVADLRLSYEDLERRVRDVDAASVDVHQVLANLTWRERDS